MADGQTFDVISLGRSGVDIYPLDHGVGLEDVSTFRKFLGGSATNVAVAAARHGHHVALVTKVGNDPFGRFVHAESARLGIDPRFISTIDGDGPPTPVTFCEIFPPDNFPLYFYRYPAAPDLLLTEADLPLDEIASAPVFWATVTGLSQEPSRATHFAAWQRRGRRSHTVLDLDYRPMFWDDPAQASTQVARALEHVSVAVGNAEECFVAVGDLAIVKQGPKGVLAATAEERIEVAPHWVEVVNGLGAGDAFGGGLIHGLLSGWDLRRTVEFANVAGAIVASRLGCSTAMPTTAEVEAALAGRRSES